MIRNPRFLALAAEKGIAPLYQLEETSRLHNGDDMVTLLELVEVGLAPKSELGKLWGDSLGVAFVELERTLYQPSVLALLPEEVARKGRMIPLYRMGEVVTLALANHFDLDAIAAAKKYLGQVSLVFSFPLDIDTAIAIEYSSISTLDEMGDKLAEAFPKDRPLGQEDLRGDQKIGTFVRQFLLLALKERASDIHIEPGEHESRIRFRIDGVLQEHLKLQTSLMVPLVSGLKIMANQDIAEKRRPLDGRITFPLPNRTIDLRFSSVPTIYGEKVVLRVLGNSQNKDVPSLSEMSLSKPIHDLLRKVIDSPNGVFFVTGPTGSGKTTTLYSVLKYLNRPGTNIMTAEDPVEYRLPGINQVQINPAASLDFSMVLRSFLRQDPDVILIGEIRDSETARIAAQAALTGHLVVATMHTNNAIQAITRLVEIGVEPFLVAPSIIGVLAQRLVRRLCPACKERYQLTPAEIERHFEWNGTTEVFFWRARSCPDCHGTGYHGRLPIHEIFVLDDDVRRMIARDATVQEIQEHCQKSGFRDMRYDGLKKVLRGLTSIQEIDRVTLSEDF